MINLLPHEKKAEIRAGRVNVALRQYIIMVIIAIAFLSAIIGTAYVFLSQQRINAKAQLVESSKQLGAYNAVKEQADTFRSQLSIAKQVLDKEIVYSDLLLRIAASIPSGVVIDNLSLDSKTIGTPLTMTAHAKDKASALKLKEKFQTRTDLYSNVYFEGLDFSSTDPSKGAYPITVRINVTINKEALR